MLIAGETTASAPRAFRFLSWTDVQHDEAAFNKEHAPIKRPRDVA